VHIRPLSTFQQYFQNFLKSFRNPSSLFSQASKSGSATPEKFLSSIRNINSAQLATYGVIFAELLGFFTIGEMVGRMKLVGYRGEKGAHH
jgi:F-type H+-transporting ATPase subunit g